MFKQETIDATLEFYETRDRWKDILNYRKLRGTFGPVKNLFYGDSITEVWPLQEFFPNSSFLNRGIGGDNVHGLYYRLEDDVFAYSPEQVFMMIGINGIEDEELTARIEALASMIKERGIKLWLCSILPLREPDTWNRFRFQDKIVKDNAELKRWAEANVAGFIDYHSAMKDGSGQLAAEFARPDGTHLTFEGYCRMSEVLRPYLIM